MSLREPAAPRRASPPRADEPERRDAWHERLHGHPGRDDCPAHGLAHGRGPRRLFRRIFIFGIALLACELIAVGLVSHLSGASSAWREYPDRLARYFSERVHATGGDPAALGDELALIQRTLGIDATVYALDDRVLASSARPPFQALKPEERERLRHGHFRSWERRAVVVPLERDGQLFAYAIGVAPMERNVLRGLLAFGAVILVIIVLSAPVAHSISAPIERLTRVVRRFGQGELGARAKFSRRDEVGELASAFDEMAARLQAQLRNEKELLANVSHELRTPISRIRIALELAAEGDVERARRYLGEISTDLGELEKLIEDVLATARLDLASDGTPPIRPVELDLGELLEKTRERFSLEHPARSFELALPPTLSPVRGDAQMVRRVVDNLVDNARKYSDDGPVQVRAFEEPGRVRVEVQDTGIGISPADQASLFRPFFRTDKSRTRGTGGVGLGLALAKRIVEAHAGQIGVESSPGLGTTFWFTLPTFDARRPGSA